MSVCISLMGVATVCNFHSTINASQNIKVQVSKLSIKKYSIAITVMLKGMKTLDKKATFQVNSIGYFDLTVRFYCIYFWVITNTAEHHYLLCCL